MSKDSERFLKEMGERIRSRRIKLGISQIDLAKKIGYSNRSSLIKLEKGEIDPSQSKMIALAKALQTTPSYLMGWEDEKDIDSQWGNDSANREYLADKPDLLEIYNDLVNNNELTILFDKTKDLGPKDIESVLIFVQMLRKQRGMDE